MRTLSCRGSREARSHHAQLLCLDNNRRNAIEFIDLEGGTACTYRFNRPPKRFYQCRLLSMEVRLPHPTEAALLVPEADGRAPHQDDGK